MTPPEKRCTPTHIHSQGISFSWSDTLRSYLAASNEDDCIVQYFRTAVADRIRTVLGCSPVNWLEIGSGPGTKTEGFARVISEIAGRHNVVATLLEPTPPSDERLTSRLINALVTAARIHRIASVTLEEYVTAQDCALLRQHNLITAIHVVHTGQFLEALKTLLKMCVTQQPTIVFVVCESDESDFAKLRRRLASLGFNVPPSFMDDVIRLLGNLNFTVVEEPIDGQWCVIDPGEMRCDESSWFLPFLLGTDRKCMLAMTAADRDCLEATARDYIDALGTTRLSVPDRALIAVSGLRK